MKPSNHFTTLASAALFATAWAACAHAQSSGWSNYDPYRGYYLTLTLWRVGMIVTATLAGFLLGWFFSPHAKELRRVIGITLAGAAILIAVFDHGALGWSTAFVISLIGFFVGLGYWMGRFVKALAEVPTTFGSGQFADAEHMSERGFFKPGGLLLGEAFDGMSTSRFAYHGQRHVLTFAPTRAGKGVSHLVPNLLKYQGSCVVIDPKGENALITAKARIEMGQQVYLVDPWNIAASKLGMEPAKINPMDWLKLSDTDAPENAMILADALVVNDGKGEAFWREEAKALIQGVMLHVAFDAAYSGRSDLGTVRDLLLGDADQLSRLFQEMAKSPHQLIASTGSRSLQKDPKLLSNVMASTQAELHMMDSPRLREAMSDSDFRWEELKEKPMTVYLILPSDRINAFSRFLRLMVEQSLTMNARNIEIKPDHPVLYILDEMPALGRLNMVEQAYGLMAGYSVQLWGIAQNVSQLKTIYGDNFETFIANAGAISYFGSKDKMSAEYFSDLCGVTTVWNFSTALSNALSSNSGSGGYSNGSSTSTTDTRAATQRKLAFPDELMRLNDRQQLVLIEDANPIMGNRLRWYEQPDMRQRGASLR
ncbi:type IV secretory system conjugative DNA transfer family protein [Roseivivax sp. THAF30]|uniref:type IV secretory system conjugative DNA transfer family protein n=1 Tax=Roseivivax sp. THAF30 TaxID=2587852 RepID=UPI001267FD76|nr:type IV secretory system conjugative DNA transfer family protein [Roseivivax sp. THAF30]QFT63781.1 Conjugal transfer protein TraG [Roseivivax sp. THAF30]